MSAFLSPKLLQIQAKEILESILILAPSLQDQLMKLIEKVPGKILTKILLFLKQAFEKQKEIFLNIEKIHPGFLKKLEKIPKENQKMFLKQLETKEYQKDLQKISDLKSQFDKIFEA